MRLKHFRIILFVVVLVLVSCSSQVAKPGPGTPGPATPQPATLDVPPEIAGHEKEWPLANHDYANTRAAVGSSINASSVGQLKVAWTVGLTGTSEWGAATGGPLISDGVVYIEDLGANVYAIDLKSGVVTWRKEFSNQIFGPSGPGIGYGKVFIPSRIDRYSALDIKTGQLLWDYESGQQSPSGAFQPYVFGQRVFVTTQAADSGHGNITFHSYQPGSSGSVSLLDPSTGRPMWHWKAVEEGFWGHPEINSGGGIWFSPAIDTQTGVSYWTTGNPSPVPGIKGWPNGSSRPGPNLYTDSLVALDENGKLLWYNQVKPHDLFNLDLQDSPMLAKVKIGGSDQDVVIASGKLGVVYGMDRATGKTLWSTPVGLHQNDELQELPVDPQNTTWVAPGAWGGVETPMAFSDGIAYVLTANLPSPYNATAYDAENAEQALNRSEGGSTYKGATAEVLALDAATGKVLWDHKFDKVAFGGVTLVNDLLFTATLDGHVYALSRKDGSVVWEWQAPGGTNSWPAVAGDTIVWAFGLGDSPSVFALSLSGNGSIPTPEPVRTPMQTPEGK